jgi:hypothetical protein
LRGRRKTRGFVLDAPQSLRWCDGSGGQRPNAVCTSRCDVRVFAGCVLGDAYAVRRERAVGEGLLAGDARVFATGAYVNFMSDEGEDRVRESYRGNYDRLVHIKRKYDPINLFRLNQNIKL